VESTLAHIAASLGADWRAVLDDVYRGFSGGAAVGTLVVYRRRQRGVTTGGFQVVTRWSAAGAVSALILRIIETGV
jgi:hypothetical protein